MGPPKYTFREYSRKSRAASRVFAIGRIKMCPACKKRGFYRQVDRGGRMVRICFRCRHEWGASDV